MKQTKNRVKVGLKDKAFSKEKDLDTKHLGKELSNVCVGISSLIHQETSLRMTVSYKDSDFIRFPPFICVRKL